MGDRNSGKTSGQGPEPQEAPSESAGYSSPPCMLHELDPSFVGFAERVAAPARPPETSAAQDWEEVRLWRKAKRAVLIERRLAGCGAVRTQRGDQGRSAPDPSIRSRQADRLLLAVQGGV